MNQGSKRGHGGEVTEARGSSIQYHRRSVPQHRVEEGHRVVDIYEDILPILNGELLPQEGAGPSVPELNFSGVIRQHNEALRLREAPPLPVRSHHTIIIITIHTEHEKKTIQK